MIQRFNQKATAVLCMILMLWTPVVVLGDQPLSFTPGDAVPICENTDYSQLSENWTYLDEQRDIFKTLFGVDEPWMDYVDPDTELPNYADRDLLFPLNDPVTGNGVYQGTTRHGFAFTLEITTYRPVNLRQLIAGSVEQQLLIAEVSDLVEDTATASQLIQSLTDNAISEEDYAELIEADQVSKAQVGGTISTGTAELSIYGEATHGIDAETGTSVSYLLIQGQVDQCGVLFQDLIEIPDEPEQAADDGDQQAPSDDIDFQPSSVADLLDAIDDILAIPNSVDCDDCHNNSAQAENKAWEDYNEAVDDINEDLKLEREKINRARDRKINTALKTMEMQMLAATLAWVVATGVCGRFLLIPPPVGQWAAIGCAVTAAATYAIAMYAATALAEITIADAKAEAKDLTEIAIKEAQKKIDRLSEALQELLDQIQQNWCACVTALECPCDGDIPCSINCNSPDDSSGLEHTP
ncbi:MAG: hypothetical protein MI923_15645 [Phycisphaerales bacterium]|nr:hypothetical protein [Phycisphaerales bacterium]